jgi:hypothetical protein
VSAKTSKTARASMPSKKTGSFEFATDASRVIPTGSGRFAYVLGLGGTTTQFRVDSDEFVAAVGQFADSPALRQTLPVVKAAADEFGGAWVVALGALTGATADAPA